MDLQETPYLVLRAALLLKVMCCWVGFSCWCTCKQPATLFVKQIDLLYERTLFRKMLPVFRMSFCRLTLIFPSLINETTISNVTSYQSDVKTTAIGAGKLLFFFFFFKEVCNLLRRSRYIFHDVSISGLACRGHVCPAPNCWNLLCVFNLKRMQGRERARGDLKRPRCLCRAVRVVHDLCKLWRRAIKNDGRVFNQARGSPHLIPGSLAKWLFLHSAVSLTALSFRASPLHVTAVSAGSRGCRVRIKRSHSDADSLSLCGSKFPGSEGVSLQGKVWRNHPEALNACQERDSGPIRVTLEDFMELKCNFSVIPVTPPDECFAKMTWPGIRRSRAHVIQRDSESSGSHSAFPSPHFHDKEIIH